MSRNEAGETPMSDHIVMFKATVGERWRISLESPEGSTRSYGPSFNKGLLAHIEAGERAEKRLREARALLRVLCGRLAASWALWLFPSVREMMLVMIEEIEKEDEDERG
jgi:hypothetical protein